MEDTRLQMPVYWGELGKDVQEDLLTEYVKKFGVDRKRLEDVLVRMDRNGVCMGHVVVYEWDINLELGEV